MTLSKSSFLSFNTDTVNKPKEIAMQCYSKVWGL